VTEIPEIGLIAAVVVLVVIMSILRPSFLAPMNLQIVFRDVSIVGLLAVGVSLTMMTAGIDLSIGSVAALTGVVGAELMVSGVPILAAIAMGMLVAFGIGLLHGALVTRLGIAPFIITLVTLGVARGLALAITQGMPVNGLPDAFLWLGQGYVIGVPVPTVIFAVVAVAVGIFLGKTYIGRQIYAAGGNKEAARLAGVPVGRRVALTYVVSSSLAGLVGLILAARLGQGQPGVGVGYELTAITAAVLGGVSLAGGQGRIVGVVFGAALLGVITNGLLVLNISPYYQQIVLGCVLGAAVILDRLRAQRRAKTTGASR
jgi:ribose transport system permease protein